MIDIVLRIAYLIILVYPDECNILYALLLSFNSIALLLSWNPQTIFAKSGA